MAGGAGGNLLTAGELRERIEFLRPTRVDDRGFSTTAYSSAFTVWASAQLKGGLVDFPQNRGDPKIAIDFAVRYRADITNDMKVIWRGITFEIASPLQPVPLEGRLTVPCLQESVSLVVGSVDVTAIPVTTPTVTQVLVEAA